MNINDKTVLEMLNKLIAINRLNKSFINNLYKLFKLIYNNFSHKKLALDLCN